MESHTLLKLLSPYAQRMQITDEEMLLAVMQILASPSSNEEIKNSLLELLSYSVLDDPLFNDILSNREDYVEMFTLLCPGTSLGQLSSDTQAALSTQAAKQETLPNRISINIKSKQASQQSDVHPYVSEENLEDATHLSSLITIPSTITQTIYIPHVPVLSTSTTSSLRPVSDLPLEYQKVFPKRITHFNRIQSESYEVLFNNSCNVLLCAPTGAGKRCVPCSACSVLSHRTYSSRATISPSLRSTS